jgi:hypothetical protein
MGASDEDPSGIATYSQEHPRPPYRVHTAFLFLLVGRFGTTITAYCWFWQSDQEVEEDSPIG